MIVSGRCGGGRRLVCKSPLCLYTPHARKELVADLMQEKKKSKSKKSKSANAKGGEVSAASDSAAALASNTTAALNGNELRKRDMTPRVEEVEEED